MLSRGEAWGVFDGERLVGKFVLDCPPYPCFAHTRWVHAVYLHPDARGTGAGAALVAAAIDRARADGVKTVGLWVNGKNVPARRLYERLGFLETGRVPNGIKVGGEIVDDILMSLVLTP